VNADLLLRRQDELGEGIVYLLDLGKIAWVNILGQKLMLANPDGSEIETYEFESTIGAVLPSADGRLVLVLRNQVAYFDRITGLHEIIWSAGAEEPEHNRFNDAAIDPSGNLWICSMDFGASATTGAIYRVSPVGEAEVIDRGYACLNGPVFSPDGSVAYVGNTMEGRVLAYDIDLATGGVGLPRQFVDFGPFDGLPDGMATDGEGNIWICHVTAGRICCYNPQGIKLRSVALPVPMVTSCAFGGPDMTDMFVTTARIISDTADLDAYPDSGSLYRIKTPVAGQAPFRFGMAA
jgi:xylono-1,5-lactonase